MSLLSYPSKDIIKSRYVNSPLTMILLISVIKVTFKVNDNAVLIKSILVLSSRLSIRMLACSSVISEAMLCDKPARLRLKVLFELSISKSRETPTEIIEVLFSPTTIKLSSEGVWMPSPKEIARS